MGPIVLDMVLYLLNWVIGQYSNRGKGGLLGVRNGEFTRMEKGQKEGRNANWPMRKSRKVHYQNTPKYKITSKHQ